MSRVFYVEDSPVEQVIVRSLLSRHIPSCEVTCFSNAESALNAVPGLPPDLIITDLNMPGMGGLELIEAVHQEWPQVQLIAITSQGSEEVLYKALKAGAASYVPKAKIGKQLVVTVESVLRISKQAVANRRLRSSLVHQDLRFCIDNDQELVGPLVEMIQDHLAQASQFNESERGRMGMALHEALTNAMYHGNFELDSELRQEDDSRFYTMAAERSVQQPYASRKIYVAATISNGDADFRIRDEGPGYNAAAALERVMSQDIERIGGRGLLLITSFMDTVAFNEAGNEIRMSKHAAAAPAVEADRNVAAYA